MSQESELSSFAALLADLGVASSRDLLARATASLAFLPTAWTTAEAMLLANPAIARTPMARAPA
jgi:hypothetical protein